VSSVRFGAELLSALVFGLAPGFRATRPDLSNSFKDISRGSVGGRHGRLFRNSLVVAEVTVTVVLVVGAALLVRSFLALYGRGPGFHPEHLLSMEITMSWEDVEDEIKAKKLSRDDAQKAYLAADRSFRARLYHELSSVPGVDTFTTVQTIPLSSYYQLSNVTIEGRPPDARGHEPRAIFNNVHGNYFTLMLPVTDVRTMGEVVSRSTSRKRFNMLLMTVFGGAALILAAIGIYGLMAYSVQQRTQEIGIRLALGAGTGNVRKMVVFQGLRLALVGVAIGIGAALGLTRLIATFLFGVKDKDPLVFTSVAVLLSLVSLLAVWVPARRATRIDPVIALRYE
jgi:hypothetical protein